MKIVSAYCVITTDHKRKNMPEILKDKHGDTNWTIIFSALAASIILVLQQWQSYRIAEIQATAEVNKVNFMSKDEINKHIKVLEDNFVSKDVLLEKYNEIKKRIEALEAKHENK